MNLHFPVPTRISSNIYMTISKIPTDSRIFSKATSSTQRPPRLSIPPKTTPMGQGTSWHQVFRHGPGFMDVFGIQFLQLRKPTSQVTPRGVVLPGRWLMMVGATLVEGFWLKVVVVDGGDGWWWWLMGFWWWRIANVMFLRPVFKCFFVIFQLYCRSSHLYQVMIFERCDHNRSYWWVPSLELP